MALFLQKLSIFFFSLSFFFLKKKRKKKKKNTFSSIALDVVIDYFYSSLSPTLFYLTLVCRYNMCIWEKVS